jgi:hypothetical protein
MSYDPNQRRLPRIRKRALVVLSLRQCGGSGEWVDAAELVVIRARVRVRHLHGGGGGARDGYALKHTHLLGRHLVLEWPEFCRIT